jgi:ATP-dependent protease ClpP protease subunit
MEILIYKTIDNTEADDSITALSVKQQLDQITGDEVVVRLNTPGGSVTEGLAIYNMLKTSGKKVTTINDGLCASIGTVIFLAGDERHVHNYSQFVIHNPWSFNVGDSQSFRKTADNLDQCKEQIIDLYSTTTKQDPSILAAMMSAETYLTVDEMIEMGFATKIINQNKKSSMDNTILNKIMNRLGFKYDEKSNKVLNLVTLSTVDGQVILFPDVEEGVKPEVGDKATDQEGAKLPDGEYVVTDTDGKDITYVIAESVITEVKEPVEVIEEPVIEEPVVEEPTEDPVITDLKNQIADLKNQLQTKVSEVKDSTQLLIETINNSISSGFVPRSKGLNIKENDEPQTRSLNIKRK